MSEAVYRQARGWGCASGALADWGSGDLYVR